MNYKDFGYHLSKSLAFVALLSSMLLSIASNTMAAPAIVEPTTNDAAKSSQTSLSQTPAATNKPSPPGRFVSIPILYMTDRAVCRQIFGPARKTEHDSIYDQYCGQLDYILPNSARRTADGSWNTLGWRTANKPRRLPLSHSLLECKQDEDVYDLFAQSIAKAAKDSGSNEIFLCVHGFNTSFTTAARDAARLAYNVKRPVVLYSWPSTAKLLQYAVDSGNNEWSQEHFNRLMEALIDLKAETGIKINLVAHSMGNRLAVRSIPVISGKHLFDQVFLVDPDFDAETFFHYVIRYKPSRKIAGDDLDEKMKVRILFSRKDRALPMAQLIFGGYTRLGQAADNMIETLINPVQVPELLENTADFIVKHSPLASDSDSTKMSGTHPHMRDKFEWIDFTAIDHGIIGHSIPYAMIASLWSCGQPGEGLALIKDKADAASGLTTMIAKSFKLKGRISGLDNCQRVILVKSNPSAKSTPQIVSSP
jgi:esterase/lipase superfamily enzyme